MASNIDSLTTGGNMNRVLTLARRAGVLVVLVILAVTLGASTASSRTTDLTNPKHFFWAPGQNPQGTVADSTPFAGIPPLRCSKNSRVASLGAAPRPHSTSMDLCLAS